LICSKVHYDGSHCEDCGNPLFAYYYTVDYGMSDGGKHTHNKMEKFYELHRIHIARYLANRGINVNPASYQEDIKNKKYAFEFTKFKCLCGLETESITSNIFDKSICEKCGKILPSPKCPQCNAIIQKAFVKDTGRHLSSLVNKSILFMSCEHGHETKYGMHMKIFGWVLEEKS